MYFDTSNLNAQYDYTPPLQGLGAGSLSTPSLRSLAALRQDAMYPWREEAPETRGLQQSINVALREDNLCPISEDGVLGPATCGAVAYVVGSRGTGGEAVPATCQEYTSPSSPPCPGAGGGGGGAQPSQPATPVVAQRAANGGTNWLLIGGVVAAVAIGGAIVLKKKKGR
jgi:hypothetical protein